MRDLRLFRQLVKVFRDHDVQRERRVVDEAYRFRGMSTRHLAKLIVRLEQAERTHQLGYTLARGRLEQELAEATGDAKMARARAEEAHTLVERMARREIP